MVELPVVNEVGHRARPVSRHLSLVLAVERSGAGGRTHVQVLRDELLGLAELVVAVGVDVA